jgi:hypothetical protein
MRRPQPRTMARVVDLTRDHMAPPELVAQAILDGLDETARQMERKWGVGRLRLLVDDALRGKFDAQKVTRATPATHRLGARRRAAVLRPKERMAATFLAGPRRHPDHDHPFGGRPWL